MHQEVLHHAVTLLQGGQVIRQVLILSAVESVYVFSFEAVNGVLVGAHSIVPQQHAQQLSPRLVELQQEWH